MQAIEPLGPMEPSLIPPAIPQTFESPSPSFRAHVEALRAHHLEVGRRTLRTYVIAAYPDGFPEEFEKPWSTLVELAIAFEGNKSFGFTQPQRLQKYVAAIPETEKQAVWAACEKTLQRYKDGKASLDDNLGAAALYWGASVKHPGCDVWVAGLIDLVANNQTKNPFCWLPYYLANEDPRYLFSCTDL